MESQNTEWLYTLSQKKSKLSLIFQSFLSLILVSASIIALLVSSKLIWWEFSIAIFIFLTFFIVFGFYAYSNLFKVCNLYLSKSRNAFIAEKLFGKVEIPISDLKKIVILPLTIKLVFHGGISFVFFDLYKIVNKPLCPYNTDILEGYLKRKERKALFLKKLASFEVFLDI